MGLPLDLHIILESERFMEDKFLKVLQLPQWNESYLLEYLASVYAVFAFNLEVSHLLW